MKPKKLRDTLPTEWVKYIVVVIVAVALWSWVFGIYHMPKETEKIEVFFAGTLKDSSFDKEAEQAFDFLKLVETSATDPSLGATFEESYSAFVSSIADVVIVPESVADNTKCANAFAPLSEIGEPYLEDGVRYGAYLSEEALTRLGKYFAFKTGERYVAFAALASVNSGKATDHSFLFIEWLVR